MENQSNIEIPLNNDKITGKDPVTGQFVKGNKLGKNKPKGSRHLSTMLKEAIKRVAKGGTESYDVLLIKRILEKGIVDGDMKAIEHIWDRLEGKPKASIDIGATEELKDFLLKLNGILDDEKD